MLSKFLCRPSQVRSLALLGTGREMVPRIPLTIVKRRSGGMIPPDQYDKKWPKRLTPTYALRVYWEIIPLFTVTGIALFLMFYSIFNAFRNKVDVVLTSHNRNSLSRTMDLRNPPCLKLVVINQRYEPWPEMQDVLDKMTLAEKRLATRVERCSFAG